MKINKRIQDAINKQINNEFSAAYLYLAMAAHFEEMELKGFSHWFRKQSQEEITHGMKLFDYLLERDGETNLASISKPKAHWNSALNAFEDAYANEVRVSGLINSLMDQAVKQKDHATASLLKWFVDEQVEEESTAKHFVQRLKLAGTDKAALLLLDQELLQRE